MSVEKDIGGQSSRFGFSGAARDDCCFAARLGSDLNSLPQWFDSWNRSFGLFIIFQAGTPLGRLSQHNGPRPRGFASHWLL